LLNLVSLSEVALSTRRYRTKSRLEGPEGGEEIPPPCFVFKSGIASHDKHNRTRRVSGSFESLVWAVFSRPQRTRQTEKLTTAKRKLVSRAGRISQLVDDGCVDAGIHLLPSNGDSSATVAGMRVRHWNSSADGPLSAAAMRRKLDSPTRAATTSFRRPHD
jgi:hypothetical protein